MLGRVEGPTENQRAAAAAATGDGHGDERDGHTGRLGGARRNGIYLLLGYSGRGHSIHWATGAARCAAAPAEDDDFDSFDSAFPPLSTNALTDRMTRLQAPTCLSQYQHHDEACAPISPLHPLPVLTPSLQASLPHRLFLSRHVLLI